MRLTRTWINSISGLPPLQSTLLKELAAHEIAAGPRVGVFSAAMKTRLLARLAAENGETHGVSAETSSVQNALDALREAGFLWRSHRGAYFIEDEQVLDWLRTPSTEPSQTPPDPTETPTG